MKTSQLFWGTFFLALGSLFLLVRYDLICVDWYFVWDLWPLILIFCGLSIISNKTKFKPFVVLLFGIFMGIIVFGTIYNIFDGLWFDERIEECDSYEVMEFNSSFDPEIKKVDLTISAGAGKILIGGKTDELFHADLIGSLVEYSLDSEREDDTAKLVFEMERASFDLLGEKPQNKIEIMLNEKPVWNIKFDLGAAKNDIDLSEYKVKNIEINSGAAKTKMKLGAKSDLVNVEVKMGASSLQLLIPEEFGVKLTGEMVFVAKNLKDFRKINSEEYVSDNFERVNKKVLIEFNGGVSSLEINRY
ncbi:MAG: hypothetical protein KJ799_18335 [Bacteroidetes bacterium]|nr:hypothetical protein [Bacteroidota bacterium]MBU1679180.1 hypothetical protein [Bacteroidota bacterium]MBU2508656.1 hypothetical protein [Bacteroidota bacterium]